MGSELVVLFTNLLKIDLLSEDRFGDYHFDDALKILNFDRFSKLYTVSLATKRVSKIDVIGPFKRSFVRNLPLRSVALGCCNHFTANRDDLSPPAACKK